MTDYASLLFDSVARLRKAATTEAVCREMVE
ncbi:LuxR family transcriptional regulator, partial [Pseudomonas aeruginosa]|nr:LuxR family transcriptional regulator [Pseudomonas aeruginosa]HEJ2737125.1 LuxR family transcriptional regulator [Pseudomonas aeruginosa]